MCGLGAGGIADMKSIHRTILARALMSTGLSLALMTAGAAGVRAEDVTVVGANGANGASGVNPGDPGQRAATRSRRSPTQAAPIP
jgi:hypothetical protein